jgi:hypothetical protein
MQNNNDSSGEDELIRLLLKRQSELNSLLEVTRAINKNTATSVLVEMLEVILENYLANRQIPFPDRKRQHLYLHCQNMAATLNRRLRLTKAGRTSIK